MNRSRSHSARGVALQVSAAIILVATPLVFLAESFNDTAKATVTSTTTTQRGIVLVSRLSDARATISGAVTPPPVIQTDFLPAHLTNSAVLGSEPNGAIGSCTSDSSIALDDQMGTLHVAGTGFTHSKSALTQLSASASAKLIELSFTLTDHARSYSMTGWLEADTPPIWGGGGISRAMLMAADVTVFDVTASSTAVTVAESGVLQPGDYTLTVETSGLAGASDSGAGNENTNANFEFSLSSGVIPTPTLTPTPVARATNLSTRLFVGNGNDIGIGGFIITGNSPKQVVLRGLGPSLSSFGIPNALADPVLELRDSTGALIIRNDNCCGDPWGCPPEVVALGLCPTDSHESLILATLDPGAYTVIMSGNNSGTGVGLIEIYDINQGSSSKLADISTRGSVGATIDLAVIGGFVIGGGATDDVVLVRGIGPSLAGSGLTEPLANPTLKLYNNSGVVVASNDDWQNGPPVSLPPNNPLESAIELTLSPGSYTALLSGVNNTTGVGVVEVYDRGTP